MITLQDKSWKSDRLLSPEKSNISLNYEYYACILPWHMIWSRDAARRFFNRIHITVFIHLAYLVKRGLRKLAPTGLKVSEFSSSIGHLIVKDLIQ